MISKSQSISVRLSEEDYAYLMEIRQNGAVTQSEKVRELIAMARESVGTESFARAFISASDTLAPLRARLHEHHDGRSAVIDASLDFLTDSAALLQSHQQDNQTQSLEAGLISASSDFIRRLLPLLLQGSGGTMMTPLSDISDRDALLCDLQRLTAVLTKE
ncbi:hypothetical protein [Thalassolituus sp.]|jgi:hypothetical protein|uniref:hypothetical protein n=1 Tax=Thalassolituus sp. TaxID=2030822 RepID=UPI00260FA805|nr:hypothetical protein [uncultured Thalassolituus sp.]